jgi:hypothetical protein
LPTIRSTISDTTNGISGAAGTCKPAGAEQTL